MARFSTTPFGDGGVNPISSDAAPAIAAGFFPPGTGLKKTDNICGVTGLEESPGKAGKTTESGDISEFFFPTGSAGGEETSGSVFVTADGVVFKAALVALAIVSTAGAETPAFFCANCASRNGFQTNGVPGVASSNLNGAGPTLAR